MLSLFPGACTGGKESCVTSAYPTRGANTGPATGHRGNVSAISTGEASFAIKVKTSVIRPPTFAGSVILCGKGKDISYPTPYFCWFCHPLPQR